MSRWPIVASLVLLAAAARSNQLRAQTSVSPERQQAISSVNSAVSALNNLVIQGPPSGLSAAQQNDWNGVTSWITSARDRLTDYSRRAGSGMIPSGTGSRTVPTNTGRGRTGENRGGDPSRSGAAAGGPGAGRVGGGGGGAGGGGGGGRAGGGRAVIGDTNATTGRARSARSGGGAGAGGTVAGAPGGPPVRDSAGRGGPGGRGNAPPSGRGGGGRASPSNSPTLDQMLSGILQALELQGSSFQPLTPANSSRHKAAMDAIRGVRIPG